MCAVVSTEIIGLRIVRSRTITSRQQQRIELKLTLAHRMFLPFQMHRRTPDLQE
jgi:hypothetical protein